MRPISTLFLLGVLLLAACAQPATEAPPAASSPNRFSDSTFISIAEAQDRRDASALYPFLQSGNAAYRAAAAEAFGSVQDSHSVTRLIPLLDDQDPAVVRAAAWALGQTGHVSGAEALATRLDAMKNPEIAGTLAEALGKCGDSTHLAWLLRLGESRPEIAPAAMQGLYRFGLRRLAGPFTANFAANMLSKPDSTARLYAAAFFGRNRDLAAAADPSILIRASHEIRDPDALQHLVRGFGQMNDPAVTARLIELLESPASDYRVRISAIRSMAESPREEYLPLMEAAIADPHELVAFEAANYFLSHRPEGRQGSHSEDLKSFISRCPDWRCKATLYAAAMKWAVADRERSMIQKLGMEIQSALMESQEPYEYGHLLLALAEDPDSEGRIREELYKTPGVSRTYAMDALIKLYRGSNGTQAARRIVALEDIVMTYDVGVMAQVATVIREEKELLKAAGDGEFLKKAQSRLELPKDIETYNEIQRSLAAIEGKEKPDLKTVDFNNPIDWELVRTIPAGQEAIMSLDEGREIRLELLVEKAPGTVANFVRIARGGTYQNASFHRVVPNFVAQGGDPRGDGWGSLPFSIRSEWPELHYGEGYMGMASAGKDTESCQWFITHNSTPHLDGRYTIFARVISGMEHLHRINIGDRIMNITFPGLFKYN